MINDVNIGTKLIELLIKESLESPEGRIKVLMYYLDKLLVRLEEDVKITGAIHSAAVEFYESLEDALNTNGQLEHVEQMLDKIVGLSLVLGNKRQIASKVYDALLDWWGVCLTVAHVEQMSEIETLLENYLEQAAKDTESNVIMINQLIKGYNGIRKNVSVGFKKIPYHYWKETMIISDLVEITSTWNTDAIEVFLALKAERAKVDSMVRVKK